MMAINPVYTKNVTIPPKSDMISDISIEKNTESISKKYSKNQMRSVWVIALFIF